MDWKSFRRQLHQIPEPGFAELKTQQFLLDYLKTLPEERFALRTWQTGILVRVFGTNSTKTLGFRTDMDGLPLTEATGLPFASRHSGLMHACGHDFHMTIAMAVLTEIVMNPIADDVVFIFQPAEEGPGGAKPLLQSKEFADWRPDTVLALHVAPEYPVGTVATRPGTLFANTSELFVSFFGRGGHAAYPHNANDMVVAAAYFVTQLQSIVNRNINPLDPAVVTVGTIAAGTKQNIIAEIARLEGTIRTLTKDAMAVVKKRIEDMLAGMEVAFNCQTQLDYGSTYMQVNNDIAVTEDFIHWMRSNRPAELVICSESMTGEDFGYFLEQIPGIMFWLGVDSPFGLHTSHLNPQEEAIDVGIRVVKGYLTHLSQQDLPLL